MLTLVEPVVATVLGAVILDHQPTAWAWFGIVVVIGALAYESRPSQKNVRH
jgi:drug/metabolite transporter (DMT)-like permease